MASCLYDIGLLVTGEPLGCEDDDESGSSVTCELDEDYKDEDDCEMSDCEHVDDSNADQVVSIDNGEEFSDDDDDDDEEDDEEDEYTEGEGDDDEDDVKHYSHEASLRSAISFRHDEDADDIE